jgi:cellulose biosynthesis protein BcsQ
MYASIETSYAYPKLSELLYDLRSTPVKIDKLLITEDSIKDLMGDLTGLSDMLQGRFFITNEIVFLMSEDSRAVSFVNHVFGDGFAQGFKNVRPPKVTIRQQESYNFQDITYLLGGKDALEQNEVVVERGALVRTKIGANETVAMMEDKVGEGKGAVVFDDIEQVMAMFNKIEAQKALIDIHNDFQGTEPILPKLDAIEKLDNKVPLQHLEPENLRQTNEPTLLVMTGERGSGKTSMAYALAKSYHHHSKTLLVDLCEHNLGLSGLIEEMKEDIATLFLEDLLVNPSDITTKAILNKFTESKHMLNAIALSTYTMDIIGKSCSVKEIEPVLASIMEIILAKIRSEYDIIIVDIPLSKYTQYAFIFNTCDYILMTFHRNISSAISLGKFMNENGIHTNWYKTVFIPTDAYRDIQGVPTGTVQELREYLEICMNHEIVMTNTIRLSGFDLGSELSGVIKNRTEALPSKLDINNYRDYLNEETVKSASEVEKDIDFSNPFMPDEPDEPSNPTPTAKYSESSDDELDLPELDLD